MYAVAFTIWPCIIHCTTSTEYVENVVKDPQNPTPQHSFIRGEINGVFGANVVVLAALVIPPSIKLPPMLIAAVCHEANLARADGC